MNECAIGDLKMLALDFNTSIFQTTNKIETELPKVDPKTKMMELKNMSFGRSIRCSHLKI